MTEELEEGTEKWSYHREWEKTASTSQREENLKLLERGDTVQKDVMKKREIKKPPLMVGGKEGPTLLREKSNPLKKTNPPGEPREGAVSDDGGKVRRPMPEGFRAFLKGGTLHKEEKSKKGGEILYEPSLKKREALTSGKRRLLLL